VQVIVDRVDFRYRRRSVLQRFSAVFERNTVTALVGPSGSGKSTVLSLLAGHTRPQAGAVWFCSETERHRASPRDATWIAQDANVLAARSVLDNVRIGPLSEGCGLGEATRRAEQALVDVGLDTFASQTCRSLSGGERQRVVIARSLASTRAVMIADEPTSGLDEGNTRVVADLFAAVQGRATVIIATHDPVIMDAAAALVRMR